MNYQQDLFSHKVTIKLGWSPVGDHFAKLPAFCDFQNGVICGHASAMTTDSGAHNFPTGEWGARINAATGAPGKVGERIKAGATYE
jgi:porin